MKEYIRLRKEGDDFFRMKDYQNAIEKYEVALSHNPQYSTGYVHLAKALLVLNKYDDAIQKCQEALNIKKDYAYAHLIKGDAHKLKAETFLSLKNFEICKEECKKSEECYETASCYQESKYNTGALRLSALKKLEELLNISIASKSTAASTDEEFEFDPEEDEENSTTIIKKEVAALNINEVIDLIYSADIDKLTDFIKQDPTLLQKADKYGFTILSAIIEEHNYEAKNLLLDIEVEKCKLPEVVDASLINTVRQSDMPMSEVRELVGHFFEDGNDWGIL